MIASSSLAQLDDSPSSSDVDQDNRDDSLFSLEAEAKTLLGQRKRRKRVRYSCTECSRRKHKCDRGFPCQSCVLRGVEDACCPPQQVEDHDEALLERTKRLESILSRLISARRSEIQHGEEDQTNDDTSKHGAEEQTNEVLPKDASKHGIEDQTNERLPKDTGKHGTERHPSWHTSTYTSSSQSPPVVDAAASWSPPRVASATLTPLRARIGTETLEFSSSFHGYSADVHYFRLVREGGAEPHTIRNLCSNLPSYQTTVSFLDIYFRDINPSVIPIDEYWFRDAFSSAADFIWGDAQAEYNDDGASHLSVIALLFILLAFTYRYQPPQLGSEEEARAQSARMYHTCRRCITLANSIQSDDLFLTLTFMILSRYLMLQRQAVQGWLALGSAIRTAQLLGLHRQPTDPNLSLNQIKARRLTWSHLYYLDRVYSLLLGHAPMISDRFCTSLPPSSNPLDLAPSTNESNQPGQQTANFATFFSLRHRLGKIAGGILELFHTHNRVHDYNEILELDRQLQHFQNSIPRPYRLDVDAASADSHQSMYESAHTLALHRYLLNVDLSFIWISLHQPYLGRYDDRQFEASRKAALQAAIWDHSARSRLERDVEWKSSMARKTYMGGLYYSFHATAAIGICLLSEPDLARVAELFPFLQQFIATAQRESGDPNRCSRQEINVITLLQARVRRKLAPRLSQPTIPSQDDGSPGWTQATHLLNKNGIVDARLPVSSDWWNSLSTPPSDGLSDPRTVQEDIHSWWSGLVTDLLRNDSLEEEINADSDTITNPI